MRGEKYLKFNILKEHNHDLDYVPFIHHFKSIGLIKLNNSNNLSKNHYSNLIILFFWIIIFKQIILIFITDESIQLTLGDLTRYWNNYRLYYLIPSIFLSIQCAVCYTVFSLLEYKLNWYIPFFSIRNHFDTHLIIRIEYSNNYRIHLYIRIAYLLTFFSTIIFGISVIRTAWINLNRIQFIYFIPWIIVHLIWIYYLIIINYLLAFYFNFICLILKNRLISIRDRIRLYFKFVKTTDNIDKRDVQKFSDLYFEFVNIRYLIVKSNSFWNFIFLSIYLSYVPCLSYTIYNLFYLIEVEVEENKDFYVLGFTWAIAIHCFIIIYLFCRPAVQIYNVPSGISEMLNKIYDEKYLPFSLRYFLRIWSDDLHDEFGYHCFDFFLITRGTLARQFLELAGYFLITSDFCVTLAITSRNKAKDKSKS